MTMTRRLRNAAWRALAAAAVLLAAAHAQAVDGAREAIQPSAPIVLTAADGRVIDTEAEFAGRPYLVYFGYTYCPDVCPSTLWAVSAALRQLEQERDDAGEIGMLFISVDPERDDAASLAEYASNFHPNLMGLHATPDQLAEIARQWNVAYEKTGGDADDYEMSHPAYVYALDRQHRVVDYLWDVAGPDKIAEKLKGLL